MQGQGRAKSFPGYLFFTKIQEFRDLNGMWQLNQVDLFTCTYLHATRENFDFMYPI